MTKIRRPAEKLAIPPKVKYDISLVACATWKPLKCFVSYKELTNCGEIHHKGLRFYGPKAGVTNSWRRQTMLLLGSQVHGSWEVDGQPNCLFSNPASRPSFYHSLIQKHVFELFLCARNLFRFYSYKDNVDSLP